MIHSDGGHALVVRAARTADAKVDVRCAAALHARLPHLELPAGDVLLFVTARPAVIVADPGWIEAHYSLDSVDTGLRRAALDLDPGYVPWLGVVVRFVYE